MITRFPYYYRKGKIRTYKKLSHPRKLDISSFREKVSEIKDLGGYKIYLGGSILQSVMYSHDLDIFITGIWNPEVLNSLMDKIQHICIIEMGVYCDVFYIENITPLLNFHPITNTDSFRVFTNYDLMVEIENGEMKKFRDYSVEGIEGLFPLNMAYYHQKSDDGKYELPRIIQIA